MALPLTPYAGASQAALSPARERSRTRRILALVASLGTALTMTVATAATSTAQPAAAPPAPSSDFGPNVRVFDSSMPLSQIQATVDAIAAQQANNEMGVQRFALLFKPGVYGTAATPLKFQVGYYTEVAGLGRNPDDVVINGSIDVYNRCRPATGCFALDSFWRSLANLKVNFVPAGTGCRTSAMFWAASQAAPVRRVNINGGTLSLMDYCTDGPQYASGGFIADSKAGTIVNGSQQQYLVRNSTIGSWSNGVWNQVFAGVDGAPAQSFPDPPYTTLAANPASREKPYLYADSSGAYNVLVPDARTNSSGTSWANGPTPGRSLPLSSFFVARPSNSVREIQSQLNQGKNLLFTPGVYSIGTTIEIKRADTVVLGMGMATLTAANGAVVMRVADVKGVDIAGLTIDAGPTNSPVLLQIGTGKKGGGKSDPTDPTALQDVFFRIGGPHIGKADLSLEVNSDDVILDNIWAWRADHGNVGTFGWDVSPGRNGVIVNGNNVTATGLFVEHYKEYNVIWNGANGRTIFFQNELPYDAPNQAAWQHDGVLGWAGYKVADSVTTHELWGGGSYVFTNVDPSIHATRGFEVPNTPGVVLHDLVTVQLGAGTLDYVVNDKGLPVNGDAVGQPSCVVLYPSPDATPPTVSITDNVAGATASGDVTFTFKFSENVCSLTEGDIVVTGGTKGQYTRVDANTATLVVTPPANSTGTVSVSLAERTYGDYAGNANTVAASAEQAFDTVVPPPAGAVITFEEDPAPTLTGFGGVNGSVVADPTNAANHVAQVVKDPGAAFWAGATISTLSNFAIPKIEFTATNTVGTVRVWSPDAGIPVRLKVENAADPGQSVETEATTTVAGAWETLSFDFANQAPGTAALNLALTYNKVSIFLDFGTPGAGKTYYVDDVDFSFTP